MSKAKDEKLVEAKYIYCEEMTARVNKEGDFLEVLMRGTDSQSNFQPRGKMAKNFENEKTYRVTVFEVGGSETESTIKDSQSSGVSSFAIEKKGTEPKTETKPK